jgi:hypothetical protein
MANSKLAWFCHCPAKIRLMITTHSSETAKKMAIRFILENIDYRKRCLFLQEIIAMSKVNDTWRQALSVFFDGPIKNLSLKVFSKN